MTTEGGRGVSRGVTLRDGLDALERCCATPVVPGELVTWLETVEAELTDLETSLRRQIGSRHRGQFEQIVREDTSLQRPVDHLQREDLDLAESFDSLKRRATTLVERASAIEPDEAAMSEDIDRFAHDALWFVIRVRKQDTAIRTWLGEAVRRERGAGD